MKKISAAMLAFVLATSTLAVTASADDADTAPFITDKKVSADFEYTTANQADAPQPVSATKKSDCVELKWNKVSGVSGYLVKAVHPWGENSGMYYQYVSGENSLSLAWSFNFDITKDWEFYVAGFVNDAYGNKVIGKAAKFDVKTEQTVTTPNRVEFTGYSKGTNYIELDWKNASADGYEVEFKDANAVEYRLLGETKDTHAKISKLAANTTYYVRVRGYKNSGSGKLYGSYSEEKIIKTDSETVTKPGTVNITKVVTGEDSLRFYWDAVANADGYQIYFNKTGNSNDWEFVANVNNKTLDYRFTNLTPEHTYWVSISAYKYDGSSNPVYGTAGKKEASTSKKGTTTETVAAPAAVSIKTDSCSVTYDAVRINWNAVKCDGYELWINETGYEWKHIANVSGDTTTYRFTKLKPNHQYWFTVCAYNKLSNGDVTRGKYSDNYYTTTKSSSSTSTVAKPAKTEFTSFSRTATAIRLNWSAVNCDGYFIYRYNYNTKAWERVSVIKGGNVTTKRFSNLTPNTTYVYKIRAFKFTTGSSKVYSEYSSSKSVATKKK